MRRSTALMSQWKADTQKGEALHFELCKGGYFSDKDEYGLKVVGKTFQDGTPTPETPIDIQCVKAGTKVSAYSKNLFKPDEIYTAGGYLKTAKNSDGTIFMNGTIKSACNMSIKITIPSEYVGKKITFWYEVLEGNITTGTRFNGGTPMAFSIFNFKNNEYIRTYGNSENTIYNRLQHTGVLPSTENESYYLMWQCWSSVCFDNAKVRIQIELGDTATDYEPYCFGGELTTSCDLYEGDIWYPMSGKVERHNAIFQITDNTSWGNWMGNGGCKSTSLPYTADTTKTSTSCFSIYGVCEGNNNFNKVEIDTLNFSLSPDGKRLYFNRSEDREGFKEYLRSLPEMPYIIYPLATPIIEQYDPQPIFAPQGTVNVLQEAVELAADLEATHLVRR